MHENWQGLPTSDLAAPVPPATQVHGSVHAVWTTAEGLPALRQPDRPTDALGRRAVAFTGRHHGLCMAEVLLEGSSVPRTQISSDF